MRLSVRGALAEEATTEDFLAVQIEGKHKGRRSLTHYNLDAISAMGYRVNSRRAVQFRLGESDVG